MQPFKESTKGHLNIIALSKAELEDKRELNNACKVPEKGPCQSTIRIQPRGSDLFP